MDLSRLADLNVTVPLPENRIVTRDEPDVAIFCKFY